MNLKHSSQFQSGKKKCILNLCLVSGLGNFHVSSCLKTFIPQYKLVLTTLIMFKEGIATSSEGREKDKRLSVSLSCIILFLLQPNKWAMTSVCYLLNSTYIS